MSVFSCRCPDVPDYYTWDGTKMEPGDVFLIIQMNGGRNSGCKIAHIRDGVVLSNQYVRMKPCTPRTPVAVLDGVRYEFDHTGYYCGHSPWGTKWVNSGVYRYLGGNEWEELRGEDAHKYRVLVERQPA